ncbi:YbgA family protein [Azotobacter chroococcum]|jgi:uncharacterized protein YbgA (DUF1722 family)/uncharacterized protein YbbK (DUF523 family)|uniref:Uncharacterized protein YbgA (DUF1722 family) n=1 Tax=Azotobacter chroococcum TaxID=353 RepID=A0A4R1PU79_9GAMM|nr:DUF523 and DUF1722 domain-containing protein [Azotobacter chroococcum]TBV94574.1 DUF1722 domain-containing protein [Azotobacter chroococcum]TCL33679.1 uncharacterized protein YbgA (DUF1722 family) [Azotobacter chroococcum]
MSTARPKIAISACLLGERVRFNAGHKESPLCSRVLASHFDFVPLCPEMAIGLGAPRQPIRLVGDPARPRAVGTRDAGLDVSAPLSAYGERMAGELDDIDGFIFMQKSPSCGLERVKVYQANGHPAEGGGRGLFAAAFCARRPELPVEEDGRLHDPVLRENFVTRVFVHADWRRLLGEGLSRQALLDFHARHKYLLMASHPQQYRALGRLLGEVGRHAPEELGPRYFAQLMMALRQCASRGSHGNVLQHLCGYLRPALEPDERAELQQLIEQYRLGMLPLVVPLTLLKHHFRRHPHPYVARQVYLQPHPEELGLRNAI